MYSDPITYSYLEVFKKDGAGRIHHLTTFYMSGISTTLVARTTSKAGTNVSINLNIRITGFTPKRVSSGISVPAKNFIKGSIVGSGKKITDARKRLDDMREKIERAYFDFQEQNKIASPDLILQYIQNQKKDSISVLTLAEMVIAHKASDLKAGNCTYHLVEKFEALKTQLQTFIELELKKHDLFLEEINHDFVAKFRMYLQTEFNNKNVTVNKKMSNLGQIFKYAVKNDWMRKDPTTDLTRLKEEITNHEFLSISQVKEVMNFELPNDTHDVLKDSFLFMCFTGMAISDMSKFKLKDINEINGHRFITYKRTKTNVTVQVPVTSGVDKLINKHYSKPIKDRVSRALRPKNETDIIFPIPAPQNYNQKLRNLFEYNELYVDFIVSSHCARKTFGNMVNGHLGLSVASQFLGHSSVSITEKNYVDNNTQKLAVSRGIEFTDKLSTVFSN